MELRIKELLREQGLRMSDLADRLCMDRSNLSKCLGNNPKLNTLQEIAKVLNVKTYELLTPNRPSRPKGVAFVDGRAYAMTEMPCVVQIPYYCNYTVLRKNIESFIKDSIDGEKTKAFCGIVDGFELVSLVFDCACKKFILTLFYSEGNSKTFFFELQEFAEYKDGMDQDPIWNVRDVCEEIINDIEAVAPYEYKEPSNSVEQETDFIEQDGEF